MLTDASARFLTSGVSSGDYAVYVHGRWQIASVASESALVLADGPRRDVTEASDYWVVGKDVALGFAVKLKSDRGTRKWTRNVTVEPGGETVVLPFADMEIDPKSVSYFNIFMSAPREETVIFIDNVRAGSARVAEKALPRKLERPDDELF